MKSRMKYCAPGLLDQEDNTHGWWFWLCSSAKCCRIGDGQQSRQKGCGPLVTAVVEHLDHLLPSISYPISDASALRSVLNCLSADNAPHCGPELLRSTTQARRQVSGTGETVKRLMVLASWLPERVLRHLNGCLLIPLGTAPLQQ